MRELNFLDIKFLVKELQDCVGARISKIYDAEGILLQLHKSGVGKSLIRITENNLWLAGSKPTTPSEPSQLCKVLRKRIEGKKITAIEQLDSERVVQFRCETQNETYFLIAELFANGNIILTNEEKKIITAREMRAWKDREIKRGVLYNLPPAKKNLFALESKDIIKDEKKLASLGFGKLLAKEIIARGGDFKAYESLMKARYAPRVYADELSPFKLTQYKEVGTPVDSFSSLLDAEKPKVEPVLTPRDKKRQKLLTVIEQQRKSADDLEKRAAESQVKGEAIYEKFQECERLLAELVKISQSHSLQEMKKKLKGHAKVKDINVKNCDIDVEI